MRHYDAKFHFPQSLNPLHLRAKPSHISSRLYRRRFAGAVLCCLPHVSHLVCLEEFVMKTLKLFALALAVAGILSTEVNAGGRRSRGCSGSSCVASSCSTGSCGSTVSSCSNGTCGQVVTSAPATTQAAPAAAPAPKETVKTEAPKAAPAATVTTSSCADGSCATGTCSSGNCGGFRGRRGR